MKKVTYEQIPVLIGEIYDNLNSLIEKFEHMDNRLTSINQEDEYLTIEESAQIFRVHPNTIRNWIKEGYLDRVMVGNRVFLRKKSLMNLEATRNRSELNYQNVG
jgi:excisionase family DNA binding protein